MIRWLLLSLVLPVAAVAAPAPVPVVETASPTQLLARIQAALAAGLTDVARDLIAFGEGVVPAPSWRSPRPIMRSRPVRPTRRWRATGRWLPIRRWRHAPNSALAWRG